MKALLSLILAAGCLSRGSGAREALQVLTYDSMRGKGSLGEYLQKEFPKFCAGCSLKFVTSGEAASLIGRLRTDRKRRKSTGYHAVLGLDAHLYRAALEENLVGAGQLFDRGPFAIIVDTKRLPPQKWPKSWKEVEKTFGKGLLVEDPRLSSAGLGWLRTVFEMKALDLESARKITARVFPSWDAAYGAFLNGEGLGVWSYLSSEAYHRCKGKSPEERERYRALPLSEGYPVQEEWAAPLPLAKPDAVVGRFMDFVRSPLVQGAIAERNWMFPASEKTPLPSCFEGLPQLAAWNPPHVALPSELSQWMDLWSL